jgi:hypothetical protein
MSQLTVAASSVLQDVAGRCMPVLGEGMTAYLAGADSIAQFEDWLAGAAGPAACSAPIRLSAAAEVLGIFAADNLSLYAKEWLRNVDAEGATPARTIRVAADDDHAVKAVLQAASAWTSGHRRWNSALI